MGLLTAKQVDNAKVDKPTGFKVLTDGNGLYLRRVVSRKWWKFEGGVISG